MSCSILLLHGRLAHTHLDAVAQVILAKRPYKMTGRPTLEWVLDRLTDPSVDPVWEFQDRAPATIWPDMAEVLAQAGLGWAYVARDDALGIGDDEVLTFRAYDPVLGHAQFLFTTWTAFTDDQGVEHPLGLLALGGHEMTDARVAALRAWQRWLDTSRFAAARTAHATLTLFEPIA